MKQYNQILVFFFFTFSVMGQSNLNPQFHLTKENLENFIMHYNKDDTLEKVNSKQDQFINFNPVIIFNNEEGYLDILVGLGDLSQSTIFTVYQSVDNTKEQELWGIYGEESIITLATKLI